jgi:hypothetical protein
MDDAAFHGWTPSLIAIDNFQDDFLIKHNSDTVSMINNFEFAIKLICHK